jgi:hypothetical protein
LKGLDALEGSEFTGSFYKRKELKMKNKWKVKNGIIANVFFLMACLGGVQASSPEGRKERENRFEVAANFSRERQVARARKILTHGLFEAIRQRSLRGVQFLVERGADPLAENGKGRRPLEFAEYLAEKYPEEPERREIVKFLCNYDPDQGEVEDRILLETARQIHGLMGGGEVETKHKQYEIAQKRSKEAQNNYETSKTRHSAIKNQYEETHRRFLEANYSYEIAKNCQERAQ